MITLIKARDLIGRPVVALASGEDIAEVRDVVYDGEANRLIGFTLNKRGRFAGRMRHVLAVESIHAVGPDAVVVPDNDAVTDVSEAPAELVETNVARAVIGARVLTTDGAEVGRILAVILAIGRRPRAVGYEIGNDQNTETVFAPISAQTALSGDNMIISIDAGGLMHKDLTGFAAAVAEALDATELSS